MVACGYNYSGYQVVWIHVHYVPHLVENGVWLAKPLLLAWEFNSLVDTVMEATFCQ